METDYWAPAVTAVPPAPPQRPSRRRAYVLGLAGALPLLVGAGAVVVSGGEPVGQVRAVSTDAPASAGWGPTWVDERGRPARWDPCRAIPYVVQAGWAPDSGRADLAEALARLSRVSGLRFAGEGDTDELPSSGRPSVQPERYGERWAPLLIAWVPAAATDLGLGDGVPGTSVTVAVPGPDGASIVSGQVALDATRRRAPGFGPGTTDGEVLLHELAHAVGLGHVLDPTQVMYPQTTSSESAFGAGDRAGLAAVGAAAGCRPAPEPS